MGKVRKPGSSVGIKLNMKMMVDGYHLHGGELIGVFYYSKRIEQHLAYPLAPTA